jgi:hypothetical protein
MAYAATAIEVMIASPSDVVRERQIVRDVLAEWNALHSLRESICLMPVGWETHSSPDLGGRPQELINERVLKHADLLVGIFWTRVGSPTGKSISGSIEEIERHLEAGKPVMLYFSTAPVVPNTFDKEQYEALETFKEWAKGQGLIETYEDPSDFGAKFRNHLHLTLQANGHLMRAVAENGDAPDFASIFENTLGGQSPEGELSSDAQQLLLAAATDAQGSILVGHYLGGSSVSAGSKEFVEEADDRRSVARWIAAVEQLHQLALTRDINGKGEIFELTHRGYEAADKLRPTIGA